MRLQCAPILQQNPEMVIEMKDIEGGVHECFAYLGKLCGPAMSLTARVSERLVAVQRFEGSSVKFWRTGAS